MSDIPHNVCICRTHGNMDSLLTAIVEQLTKPPLPVELDDALFVSGAQTVVTFEACSEKFKIQAISEASDEEKTVK